MKETTNPIILARKNATTEQYKNFVIKPTQTGFSHYRAMIRENAEYWKSEAWFVYHCIETLGMTFQDFQPPIRLTQKQENNTNAIPV